jgi:glutathione S-transferase
MVVSNKGEMSYISDHQEAYDVTTIKVTMKYPTNCFEIFSWDFCPYSLKTKLAFEHKALFYNDIEYIECLTQPFNGQDQKRFEAANGNCLLPQLKVQYKNGVEESWLSDSTDIIKFLDSLYPVNSLFFSENISFYNEISLLEDWIDEAFRLPYLRLLFLNAQNYEKLLASWSSGDSSSLFDKFKSVVYKKEKVTQLAENFASQDLAHRHAVKRLDQDLLPILCDKIEAANRKGYSYILGNELTAADLAAYSFMRQILNLQEGHLISRRPILQKYVQAIEDLQLNKEALPGKKSYTRQKLVLIGENKETQ